MRNLLDGANDPDTASISLSVASGDDWKPVTLNVFVPIAIASIGELRGMQTVEDRSVPISLKRATKAELRALRKARRRVLKQALDPLARKCVRWAADSLGPLKDAPPPNLPDTLSGREQDKWEPLVKIADLAGGDWPAWARAAAIALSGASDDAGNSLGEMLLTDLKEAFQTSGAERLGSKEICEKLSALEARPWAEMGKSRKPITQHRLARMLKLFFIFPASDGEFRGYRKADFEDAFERYSSISPVQSVKVSETLGREEESAFFKVSDNNEADTSEKFKIPNGE